ncbi:unnamed protein product [Darwinula stevensoni]|uniref:Uncharacterized protein n=1 Tax=Darwinula stevensoni TaxID=69355 RepID=A0A7R9AEB1_9CRUS|nr:unnamed protein product [Darwinula stevensoni]CAG0902170.1 unnamed protein product [Darwinula stevensoni]
MIGPETTPSPKDEDASSQRRSTDCLLSCTKAWVRPEVRRKGQSRECEMVPCWGCVFSILFVGFPGGCRMSQEKFSEAKCCPGPDNHATYNANEGVASCRGAGASPTSPPDCRAELGVHLSNSSHLDSISASGSFCHDDFLVREGDNDTILEAYLFCNSVKSDRNQAKKTILLPKCCPLEEGFDRVQRMCVSRPFHGTLPRLNSMEAETWDPSRYYYLVRVDDLASNPCSKKYLRPGKDPRQHYEVQETGRLRVRAMNDTYPIGEYCLDHFLLANGSWIQMALACDPEEKRILQECEDRVCVQKCCPLGQFLHKSEKRPQCIPGGVAWDHRNLFGSHSESRSLPEKEVHNITSYPKCPGISGAGHLLQPTEDPRDSFSLTSSGALQIEAGISIPVPRYCIDYAGNSSEATQLVALVCAMEISHEESDTMYFIKSVLIILLAVFLLLTFLLYLALPESTSVHGVTLLSYVGCLLVASVALIVGQIGAHNGISNSFCLASVLLTFYGYLAAFFWLNVMSFDVWFTVRRERNMKLIGYNLYAYGASAVIFIIACILEFTPGIPPHIIKLDVDPEQRCGFNGTQSHSSN